MSRSIRADQNDRGELRREVAERLEELREECPTNYGYLVRQWSVVREGIEETEQNYPSAKQIHGSIPDGDSTPRTVGPALKALDSLNVIGLWSESVGANRYDLTAYDPRRADVLDDLLDDR